MFSELWRPRHFSPFITCQQSWEHCSSQIFQLSVLKVFQTFPDFANWFWQYKEKIILLESITTFTHFSFLYLLLFLMFKLRYDYVFVQHTQYTISINHFFTQFQICSCKYSVSTFRFFFNTFGKTALNWTPSVCILYIHYEPANPCLKRGIICQHLYLTLRCSSAVFHCVNNDM